MYRIITTLCLIIGFSVFTNAQNLSKKKMDHSVFDEWKDLSDVQISNDGSWISYDKSTEEKDKLLVLVNTESNQSMNFQRSSNAIISSDNTHLVFKTSPAKDSLRAMRKRKVKEDELPSDTLCIYNLRTKNLEKIPNYKNYKMPKKWPGLLFYQLKPTKEEKKGAKVGVDSLSQQITLKWDDESDEKGSRLYIKYLNSGLLDSFIYVLDYTFADKAPKLIFHSKGDDSTFLEGVYKYDCDLRKLDALTKEKGEVKNLTLSENGKNAAFIINKDTTKIRVSPFEIMFSEDDAEAKIIVHHNSRNIPSGWYVNENYKINFSKDNTILFYGVNPKPVLQDTSLLDDEIVNVEVWSYQDKRLHTNQKTLKDKEIKKAYIMRYDCKKGSSAQISFPENGSDLYLSSTKNEKLFLLAEEQPYLESISWEGFPTYKDIYLLNVEGKKELLDKKVRANISISPNGKYIYYFSSPDSEWFCINTKTKKKTNLSSGINTKVYNELHDTPSFPWPYGRAGWTTNDENIIIMDRYDLWQVDPDNPKKAKKLTNGREDKITYRYIRLDKEETNINANKPMLLSFYDDNTGAEGYANFEWKNNDLQVLITSDHDFNNPIKAKDADKFVFRRQSFNVYPNIEVTNSKFENPVLLSNANPQQDEYSWGDIEWYNWTAHDGQKLRGLLVKPENFDPEKSYPMLVNFYEKSSTRIHRHRAPYPGRSTINYSFYANRGYIIFNPDVPYKNGYPGQSCYNAVVSGVEALIKEGFVDKDKIGVQGHSWGGYQVAHLLTKTDIFACAESGAPVVNMISAYGGIRWQTGLSRMFQYEHTQSRIGGTLWEKPELYIENSPIFEMDKVNTPVLIMHNDKDGHVPWYQGIEYFVAMRRLNKPAWMLNYNEEPHWPLKRVNRMDFNLRMQQFFDHYLRDEPMPTWMKKGVSAIDKGINQGYELDKMDSKENIKGN